MTSSIALSKQALDRFRVGHQDLRAVLPDTFSEEFNFNTTADVAPFEGFIGQDRAVEALEFGLGVRAHGWNIFIVEPSGSGRSSTLKHTLELMAPKSGFPEACDIVCVYNFAEPERPKFIKLGKGQAKGFSDDIFNLFYALERKILAYLRGPVHRGKIAELETLFTVTDDGIGTINKELRQTSIDISCDKDEPRRVYFQVCLSATFGFIVVVVWENGGMPLDKNEISALGEEEVKKITEMQSRIMVDMQQGRFNNSLQTSIENIQAVAQDLVEKNVRNLFLSETEGLVEKYGNRVKAFIHDLGEYLTKNIEGFLMHGQNGGGAGGDAQRQNPKNQPLPFNVKVFVDNSDIGAVPIVFEHNPSYYRLFGEIRREVSGPGVYKTDHTMVEAGSFLKANGGILVLQVEEILQQSGIWERLISALSSRSFDVSEIPGMLSLLGRGGITPETIEDVNVKLVLVGNRWIYQEMLAQPLFADQLRDLFKITAEFDIAVPRTRKTISEFAGLISAFCSKENLAPLDVPAVVGVLNYASRMAGHRERFSLDMRAIKDIIVESARWASAEGADVAREAHVRKALEKSVHRASLLRDKVHEQFRDGLQMVEVAGSKVGQVNGLGVFQASNLLFSIPTKVTAQTFVGGGGIINIEGLVGLSGPFHKKSFETLKGYVGRRYAQKFNPSFSATVSFEQSHFELDGDSALLVQIYSILSSLSRLPLHQGIAVTGSMNQLGEVQPIGHAGHKIEGFFDVCVLRGLTGEQGVIIPSKNKPELVLREDVVEAVRQGQFHIWAISTMEEGLEILTGVKAGDVEGKIKTGPRKGHDKYPKDSVNFLVAERLWELTEATTTKGNTVKNRKDKSGLEQEGDDAKCDKCGKS